MDWTGDQPHKEALSDREVEVLRLLAEGLTNREIGERLFLSLETIKWYNKQIYQKLGVNNRGQAVARARELGLLTGDPGADQQQVMPSFTIPRALNSFIGREQETAELLALLKESCLVTITGPGGSGKTRLSLHVAEKLALHFASGVTFISLAATRDPAQVAGTIAQELGVVESVGRVLVESLQRNLANKQLLLILDNFEHLLSAAPLVTDLLAAAPRLTVLATSREPLHLRGEREYPLYPLALPAAGQVSATSLEQVAAIALFNQRAQAACPGYKMSDENAVAVATICGRLDGLPLAIELAAAWIKLFKPQQLLERLDKRLALLTGGPRDAPDRQRTLRNTLDWSYQLLDKEEQIFFYRLAVFVGGRTMEAMHAICTPGLALGTLRVVSGLYDKSLLYQEQGPDNQPRFIMLETIHEYTWERLIASGEEEDLRNRHLAYFLELVEEMGAGYRWHDQLRLLEQTAAEMNNLRAAFSWALQTEKYEAAARIATALDYYLYYKGSSVEGFDWFQRVIPYAERIPIVFRIRFLIAAGRLAWVNNRLDIAQQLLERSHALSRDTGDRLSEAWSLVTLGSNQLKAGTFDEGMKLANQAQSIFEKLDDLPGLAQAYIVQGEIARMQGNTKLARQKYEASLAVSQQTGEVYRQVINQSNLSMTLYNEGDFRLAMRYSLDAMQEWIKVNARQGMISQLAMSAGPLSKLGEPLMAARLLAASEALYAEMGAGFHPTDIAHIDGYKADVRQQLGEDAFAKAWAEGSTMSLSEAIAYTLKVEESQKS